MAFSTSGTSDASGDDEGFLIIADFALGNAIRTNRLHIRTVETLDFHPTENLLLTASQDGSARIWNWQQADNSGVTLPHPTEVKSAEFSPNVNRALTACKDGVARIWDWRASPPREAASLKATDEGLKSAHFNANGTLVVTAGVNGNVRVWNWQDGSK